MRDERYSDKLTLAANQHLKEKKFWLDRLRGDLVKSSFPFDFRKGVQGEYNVKRENIHLPGDLGSGLMKLSKGSDHALYITLVTGLIILINKYTNNRDILIGAPIYKQDIDDELINTILVLRSKLGKNITFRQLLFQVRQTIFDATENYCYPIEKLGEDLNLPVSKGEFQLFDIAVLLENIHNQEYVQHITVNMRFDFSRTGENVQGRVEYNALLYENKTVNRIVEHFRNVLTEALLHPDLQIEEIDILSESEKRQLLFDFNNNKTGYPKDKTISQLFEEQAAGEPDRVAIVFGENNFSYGEINRKANRLAQTLRKKGVTTNRIVGIVISRSVEMMIGIIGILKAGGAYLPIDIGFPANRVIAMLEDCNVSILLTDTAAVKKYSFSSLQNLSRGKLKPHVTALPPQIENLDRLPFPDRSLVNYARYHKTISIAMGKHAISILGTRGCPYNCAYCHKIWPKRHIYRSAENIFDEILRCYEAGIRRFVFIDDVFNLNIKNGSRLYRMIIKNNLKIQVFFPNGVRGDILTKEYIDLMMEAGTVNLMMALETASPRLQKLLGKNMNIDKFEENLDYFIEKYPQMILEMNIMHGFPSETEEEALMSLHFAKRKKWIHFPNMNILKIYPNTNMERLARQHGVSGEAIEYSFTRAYHELPDTLPFEKSFTLKCQADLFNDYFLDKERLLSVLPHQMKVLSEDEIAQKYDSYLPARIKSFTDLLDLIGISRNELRTKAFLDERTVAAPDFSEKMKPPSPISLTLDPGETSSPPLRILLLDLSRFFSTHTSMLYDVAEAPIGLMYLLTYLNQQFGSKINGKIAHARMDFDSYEELNALLEEFNPDIIGIRTLTFFRDFFHQTISLIRQWGFDVPIISGGPYATSDWHTVLQDSNIDLVVRGEGELTFSELVGKIIANNGKLPGGSVLMGIPGLAFIPREKRQSHRSAREIIMLDELGDTDCAEMNRDLVINRQSSQLAYVIFTSGSTGKPKGTGTKHHNVIRVVKDTNYINVTPVDRILQLSNYAFDGSVFDIYGALLNGAALVMIKKEDLLSIDRLAGLIEKNAITVFFVTTALFNALVELKIDCLGSIRNILFGGEKISVEHTNKALKYLGKDKIIHVYGPTETTVFAAYYFINEIDSRRGTIPIGRPIANTSLYILNENLKPVPFGVIGEIYIGGDGLARGYLNNEQLTSEKFIADPFAPGEFIYKSGDLGRWLPEGDVEFLGRIDHQVKVRGFRIELQEIENRLLKHEEIKETVVIARADEKEGSYLCAYFVTHPAGSRSRQDSLKISQLKTFLSENLPDYMIPAYFIEIDHIPLTTNGKIDCNRLPQAKATISENYVPPRNETERKLVEIWSEVLGVENKFIGIDTNFFDLGGHSLKATLLTARVHKEFNVRIPMAELFKNPFIRQLAGYVTSLKKDTFSGIETVEKKEYYGLSSAQKRLYVLHRMVPDSIGYNVPQAVLLEGHLDIEKLEGVFVKLIERHQSLRTSFSLVEEEAVQRIHDKVEFSLEYHESCSDSDENIIENFLRPFDLSMPPLLRVGLIKMRETKYILVVDIHHIVTDGTSMGILIKEFMELYQGKELPGIRIQYKGFSKWQNQLIISGQMKKQEEYWKKRMEGDIPVLCLPTDFQRSTVQTFEGNYINFEISPDESRVLRSLAASEEVTLFIVILALYNIFLAKVSSQEDILVGIPIAGRSHVDLEYVIGMFVNTLVLRNSFNGEKTFNEFLSEVKECALGAFENQDYQLEELIDQMAINRDVSRNPLFDVMFSFHNETVPREIQEMDIPGLKLKPYEFEINISKFDLTLNGVEYGDRLGFIIEYSTKLFSRKTIDRFIVYFKNILSTILRVPGIKLDEIEIISEAERSRLLYDFNNTVCEYPIDKPLPRLFQEQVESTPGYIAVIDNDEKLTYSELNEKSDQLAHRLRESGVKADTVVGVMIERSIEMIVGIFAVLKSGGAYLPIDPGYPEKRKQYMLKDSDAKILLTRQEISSLSSPEANPRGISPQQGGQLAYIIYTSGSTGKPKGVAVEHHSLVNRLNWMQRVYPIGERDVILQKTTFTFDVSVWELFWWSWQGASVCLLKPGGEKDPEEIAGAIERNNVTTLHFVPSMFSIFLNYIEPPFDLDKLSPLRQLFTSGEALLLSQVERFNRLLYAANRTKLINLYGPTEATVDVSYFNCSTGEELLKVPIGKPIDNIRLYIMDKSLKLQAPGVVGELCISGVGLARGYLNRPELTAKKFVRTVIHHSSLVISSSLKTNDCSNKLSPNDQCPMTNDRLHRTGDLARWLPDGNIEFLGRMDHQVKIRGFRIELGEIESRLTGYPGIKESVVICKEYENGDKHLCAYIVSEKELNVSVLREFLSKELPEYMIPHHFMALECIPLTVNGKLDRTALPHPVITPGTRYASPRDKVEKRLVAIWSEVLGIEKEKIGIDTNFFELGGHSLKATVLVSKIHKEFDVRLPLVKVFKAPKINALAQYIRKKNREAYMSIQVVEKKEYYSLSSAQKRLYILQQMELGSTAYNMPEFIPLEMNSDLTKIEETFKKLIKRHENFRTSFYMVKDYPVQKIHDEAKFELEYYDASPGEAEDISKNFVRAFDLSQSPLLRVGLVKLPHTPTTHKGEGSGNRYILLVDMHHIISDGVSHELLVQDFTALYQDERLSLLRIQYKDFSQWQNSEREQEKIKSQEKYWLKEFDGEIPVLELPTDYPRPVTQGFAGSSARFEISADETEVLKKMTISGGSTMFMVLLAIFNILLSKLSNHEDIIVGTPIAGRRHADLEKIIGVFINTLALRSLPLGEKTFREFLTEVKERTLKAFENQEYQFEDLVEKVSVSRDISRNPLFDVMFSFHNEAEPGETQEIDVTGPKLKPPEYEINISKFDMTLTGVELNERLYLTLSCSSKLFKKETLQRFVGYFKRLVSPIIANADEKIAHLQIISEKEMKQVLYLFNNTEATYPCHMTIHGLFNRQAYRTPDNIAVIGMGNGGGSLAVNTKQHLTYGKLSETSDRLARLLLEKGCSGTRVAIMSEPSIEIITAIMAVLKTGSFYLPIDPANPGKRIAYMLNDSEAQLLLTQEHLADKVAFSGSILNFYEENQHKGAVTPLGTTGKPGDTIYMIYTSGSTGKPKGVMIKHENLVNYVNWFSWAAALTVEDRTALTSSFSFDLGYTSLYSSLLEGGQLHILPRETYASSGEILAYIHSHRISYLKMTPSLFGIIAADPDFSIKTCRSLRLVVLGGEAINVTDVEKAYNVCPHIKIMNHYGPTEATIGCIAQFIDPDDLAAYRKRPTIGRPIFNTKAFILDRYLNLLPTGIPGELCISGAGLAQDYLKREALTSKKFIPNHFMDSEELSSPYHRIYRTGDLGRWLPDGNIEFLGRIDHQVKIRGYRIELGEIESQLRNQKGIKEVIAAVKTKMDGNKYLCAYIVPRSTSSNKFPGTPVLKEYLSHSLPDYMIPSHFIEVEKIPLTPNGKVDYKKLPEPEIGPGSRYVKPRDELEQQLVEIYSEVLGIKKESIGIDDNFFELGGHSLKATVMTSKIVQALNIQLPVVEIFKTPTIRGLTQYLKTGENKILSQADENLVLLKQGIKETVNIFFIHDGTGEVEGYMELCKHLTGEYNCWGIQANRLENAAPQNWSIEELAKKYVQRVKRVRAHGPYYILGWSLGGIIAFEMTSLLEQMNEKINFLALVDSPPPQVKLQPKTTQFNLESELRFIKNYLHGSDLQEKLKTASGVNRLWLSVINYLESNNYDVEMIKKMISEYGMQTLPNYHKLNIKESIYYLNVGRTFRHARALYTPSRKIHTPVNYFSASQSKGIRKKRWNDYCGKSIKFYEITGDHFSILKMPQVLELSKVVDVELKVEKETFPKKNKKVIDMPRIT